MQLDQPADRGGHDPVEAQPDSIDDELPGADARAESAPDAPATEADAIGYDDPSQSPVRALRDAADNEEGKA